MAGFPSMTKAQLAEGVEVAILGSWYPRTLDDSPRGKVRSWRESRFGGIFVEVEVPRTEHERNPVNGEPLPAIMTYALSDLALP